jgi:addiction module RelB/DinJ family antitoxin
MKETLINFRTDPIIKMQIERICRDLGITLSALLNIYLTKTVSVGGLPFELKKEQPQNNAYYAFKKYSKVFEKYRGLFKDENDIIRSTKLVRKENHENNFR